MLASCDASVDVAQRTKYSGMSVRDWVAGVAYNLNCRPIRKQFDCGQPCSICYLFGNELISSGFFSCGCRENMQLQRSGENNIMSGRGAQILRKIHSVCM